MSNPGDCARDAKIETLYDPGATLADKHLMIRCGQSDCQLWVGCSVLGRVIAYSEHHPTPSMIAAEQCPRYNDALEAAGVAAPTNNA